MRGRIPKRGLGLGSAVRRIRELRGVGQEILAERSGLSQGYLSQIESGAWTGITEDVLGRIARALGMEPWSFWLRRPVSSSIRLNASPKMNAGGSTLSVHWIRSNAKLF